MFQTSGLKLREVVVPSLEKGAVIPNEQHPSDHLPVKVTLEFINSYEFAQNAVKVWCAAVLGNKRITPLNKAALEAAFAALSVDGEVIDVDRIAAAAEQVLQQPHDDLLEGLKEAGVSGEVTLDDFFLAYSDALTPDRLIGDDEIDLAFEHFDHDGDGRISFADLQYSVSDMSPVPVTEDILVKFFERANVDTGDSLSRKSFIHAVKGTSISRTSVYQSVEKMKTAKLTKNYTLIQELLEST
jgi:Ca2+-binding EF-hand superfamily protein